MQYTASHSLSPSSISQPIELCGAAEHETQMAHVANLLFRLDFSIQEIVKETPMIYF
jgi:hypothetical protein